MKTVMGIVDLQEKKSLIRELADQRAVESIPFAGRYRLIDFALSSMVNSGVRNVGIMLPDEPRSVLDHLRSGKDWDL
ncbi:MAG: glucose-1-phosphate adenylyltransferase subunit GlgD, partial [Selenomonas bovis]|nr:glucose-1-phosphate adenylyltransferase subunit GlgD [Selenomonas bovis]